MYTPRRSLIALGMSTLLLVGGCNGDSNSSDEPTKTFTPTVSPTPSEPTSTYTPPEPAKPPMGGWPEDKPVTEISAEEVARLWVNELSNATEWGNTSRLRRLGTARCDQCSDFADDIDEDFADGVVIRTRGDAFTPRELIHVYGRTADHVEIALRVRASGGSRRESPDAAPVTFKAQEFKWYFVLAEKKGLWRITEMDYLE